jgi:hypothetical protein
MCGGLAERRQDEALATNSVPDGGNPHQDAVDIVNGIHEDEDQKDHKIVDFLQIKQKSSELICFLSKDLASSVWELKIWVLSLMMLL